MKRTKELLRKYIHGQCTAAELDQVFELLQQGGNASDWDAVWEEDVAFVTGNGLTSNLSEPEVDRLYTQLLDRLRKERRSKSRRLWFRAAAAVWFLFFAIGSITFFTLRPFDRQHPDSEIEPGSNLAMLTLPDGQSIMLENDPRGIVVDDDMIRYQDGTAISSLVSREAPSTMLTLSTPRGGEYQITLPDGTKVWLNAASKLTYPSRFDGPERRVELVGEGYFEVASVLSAESEMATPFFVNSPGQEIKVLGTQFNVNTYDREVKTSLLEGSVQVSVRNEYDANAVVGELVRVLEPGQQAIVHRDDHTIRTQTIDVRSVIAWKEGYFYFSGDLSGILDQISRWYVVDVVYTQDARTKVRIDGRVSRSMTLTKLLTYLEEATGSVKFDLQTIAGERRIIVKNID